METSGVVLNQPQLDFSTDLGIVAFRMLFAVFVVRIIFLICSLR